MLVPYSVANFKSFRDPAELSLKASTQRPLSKVLIRRRNLRLLPSLVIYGANASGRSNLIASFLVLKRFVLSGTIRLASRSRPLELLPFAHAKAGHPMSFEIDFIQNDFRLIYRLAVDCDFLQKGNERIASEGLSCVDKKEHVAFFTREFNRVTLSREKKALRMMGLDSALVDTFEKRINANLDSTELFLSRAFKNTINNDLADAVISFFRDRLLVVTDFVTKRRRVLLDSEVSREDYMVWNDVLDAFVKGFDFGPQSLRFIPRDAEDDSSGEGSADLRLVSEYAVPEGHSVSIPSELMESRGTLKLVYFAVAFSSLFDEGGVFVLDEFDSSIHPELIKEILQLFNDPDVNRAGAQLIFTTHNPIYLDRGILRRDQIRFVEKSADICGSYIYSLADFGSTEVRSGHNYLTNYFKGRYGALPFIDLSSLLAESGGKEG